MPVFVHGLGQTAADWSGVTAALGGEAPCCPQLTELLDGGPATYRALFQGFVRYCDGLCAPLDLCGLSLGAVLALNYAIEYPERVRSLALVGAQYRMPRGLLTFQSAVFRLMPGRAFQSMGFSKADVIMLTASMRELDFSRELGRITCPVLVVCGERDKANRKAAQGLAKALPEASFTLIPDAGHEVNREAPKALANLLSEFFSVDKAASL